MLKQDIHKSWQRFKIGLSIFVVGVLLLFTLSELHITLHYLSLHAALPEPSYIICRFRYRHVGLLGNFYSAALFFYEKQKATA